MILTVFAQNLQEALMQSHRNRASQKLTTSKRNILRLVLAVYLLVAMGLFSWIPLFLFQHGDVHQTIIHDSGYTVVWTIHHVADHDHQHALNDNAVPNHLHAKQHIPDHVLDVPSDDFIKYMLKVAVQAETLTIFSGFLLLWAFITLLKFFIPRDTGRIPVFKFPIRNSIPILARTVVLRH